MNGKHSSSRVNDEMGDIKKGPWKAEEDEVLVHHVKRYGPRDWSSIRSKGLLHRTGKSCRLRWVNKLRPNLKNGVKFSADEERVVIELQAEFGNKWARIATYLPGRTDNDVKNFWSSRQKRLARLLHTPASSSSSSTKSHRTNKYAHAVRTVPSVKVSKFSSLNQQDETFPNSQSFSASFIDQSQTLKLVPFPDLMQTISFTYDEQSFLQSSFNTAEKIPCTENALSHLSLPMQSDFTPLVENQDLVTGICQDSETLHSNLDWAPEKNDVYELLDSNYLDAFGEANFSELSDMELPPLTFLECERSSEVTVKKENCPATESMLDDLQLDVFDHIDPLPSPSNW